MTRSTILIVDDEAPLRSQLASIGRSCGFDVLTAIDGEEAIAALSTTTIDIVVADLIMPRLDGYELLRWMHARGLTQPVLMIKAHHQSENNTKALRLGAYDYITKPFHVEDVGAALRRAEASVEHRRADAALRRRNRELAALNAISTAVSSSLELEEMLNRTLGAIVEALDQTGAIIYLTNATGTLQLSSSYGDLQHVLQQAPPTIAELPFQAVAIGEAQVSQLLGTSEQIAWHSAEALKAAIPLLANGTPHGLLLLAGPADHLLLHDQLALLEAIGNYVGVAIANVKHYTEVRDTARLLERLVAERTRELQRSRDLLRIIFDGIPDGLLLANADGRILATNSAYAGLFQQQAADLVGQTYDQIWSKPWSEKSPNLLQRCITSSNAIYQRDRLDHPERSLMVLDHYLFPVYDAAGEVIQVIEYLQDVTERLALESVLAQSEQLAALGKLAATVAHEVNTPLLAIRGCLSLIASPKIDAAKRSEYLDLAESELDRAATIIRSILDFYRSTGISRMAIDINDLIAKVVQLLNAECMHRNVVIALHLASTLPEIKAAPDRIKQVLLNLMINALDVVPDGGQVTLRTSLRTIEQEMSAMTNTEPSKTAEYSSLILTPPLAHAPTTLIHYVTSSGPFIVIEIEDTGSGVPEELQVKIFDAFVTTKAEGNGLGLAVCRTIVQDHQGFIGVANVPGGGACFTVGLPVKLKTELYAEAHQTHSTREAFYESSTYPSR
jgi:two-component system NtrC family sensor kinase